MLVMAAAHFEDLTGMWRCLPADLAVDHGGCFYYEPWRTLNLYDEAEFAFGVARGAVLIARLELPNNWIHLSNGDSGHVSLYPLRAGMSPSVLDSHGWLNYRGTWTAKSEFADRKMGTY